MRILFLVVCVSWFRLAAQPLTLNDPAWRGAAEAAAPPAYTPNATFFNGTNAYFSGGSLGADSYKGAISLWLKVAADGTDKYIYTTFNQTFKFRVISTKQFYLSGYNSSATKILELFSSNDAQGQIGLSRGWTHVLVSWDMTPGGISKTNLYIDDLNVLITGATCTFITNAGPIDLTGVGRFGRDAIDSGYFSGCMMEIYLNSQEFIDFAVSGNRRKFDDGGSPLKPISLGSDGSLPTGTQPRRYFKSAWNAPTFGFGTDSGSSGNNMTPNGTFDQGCATP